jgi:basic membrane protein A
MGAVILNGNNQQPDSSYQRDQEQYLTELQALRRRLAETMANAEDQEMRSELAFQLEKVDEELHNLTAPPPATDPPPEVNPPPGGDVEQPPPESHADSSDGDDPATAVRPTAEAEPSAKPNKETEPPPMSEPAPPSPSESGSKSQPDSGSESGFEPRPESVSDAEAVFFGADASASESAIEPLASTAATTGDHPIPTGHAGEATTQPGGHSQRSMLPSLPVLAVVVVCLGFLAGLLWFGDSGDDADIAAEAIAPASATSFETAGASPEEIVENIRAVLVGLGLTNVVVDFRDDSVHLGGPVETQEDVDSAIRASQVVAGTYPVIGSALVVTSPADSQLPAAGEPAAVVPQDRSEALQSELNRILASTPLIFESSSADLTDLHQRVLNTIASTIQAYPGADLTVAGFTDGTGTAASNDQLSLTRASNVRDYLVSQGVPSESVEVAAQGASEATGSAAIAGLERRVEFVVSGVAPADPGGPLRVAVIAPSAANDLAFTQSMVDAVNLIATERSIELAITDNTFVPEEAQAVIRSYAEQGFDLIVAHGSQFGAGLVDIAPQFPDTAFAWGTASDTFGLSNVYSYDAAAHEGGYILGALAARLSGSKTLGVVGPIEVGDAARYINGFRAGAAAENPGTNVLVSYTGSFSDIGLAAEAADAHLAAGADILTGSAQMVVGAISRAQPQGALWFGTQSNQTSLAPDIVVASQVYRWAVVLRPILDDIAAGNLSGSSFTASLANGGLAIEYNPAYPLDPEVSRWADSLTAAIIDGTIVPPGQG